MKIFTKVLFTLALLVVGVAGTRASRVNLTFETPDYCAASWDAGTKTFTWGSGGWNSAWTFMAVSNLKGDISAYTKLVFKLEDFTNSVENKLTIYFKGNIGNTQSMDHVTSAVLEPDADGYVELDLTTLDWTNDNDPEETIDNTDIADVTIYGGARTVDTQDGSVKVTEAYAEVTGDDVDRCIVYDGEAKTNPWDKQAVYDLPTAMVQGKTYIVKADIKSAKGGECALWPIDNDSENKNEWGGSLDVQYLASYNTTTSFTTYTWQFEASFPHDRLQFVFGLLDGKIYFDNVSCKEVGTETEMIENGDFSVNNTAGWSANGSATFALEEIVSDPLEGDKEALSAQIDLAKLYNGVAYTDASFGDLTDSISDAETALDDENATAESLATAKDNIQAKIDALEFKEGYENLTADMFKAWDSAGADAVSTGTAYCTVGLLTPTDLLYGESSVGWLHYADLSSYDKLIVVAKDKRPRFMLNRTVNEGQWSENEEESNLIDNTKGGWSAKYFSNEENVYTADLVSLVDDKGFAHLNAIKVEGWQVQDIISGMYLYKAPDPLRPQKEALQEKINAAKLYSSVGKTTDSYDALAAAISEAEDAVKDKNATEEGLNDAAQKLQDAIDGLTRAANYVELSTGMFKHYASVDNPGDGEATGCAYETFTASGLPYGDGNVSELNWADLAGYEKLVVVTQGAIRPRFCLNRLEAGGNQAYTQEDSKMIDINDNADNLWSATAYQTIEDNVYTIDLQKIVEDYGFARLHCIKKQGWGEGVFVTDMYLYNSEVYTVVGSEELTGFDWAVGENYMTLNKETGKYEKTFKDITVNNSSTPAFNVVKNGTEWYPGVVDFITISPEITGSEGIFDITITFDPSSDDPIDIICVKHPSTFYQTVTYTNVEGWGKVYAYIWTEGGKKYTGDWPGAAMTKAGDVYTYTLENYGVEADVPASIVFNNGGSGDYNQTLDLAFEADKQYTDGSYVTVKVGTAGYATYCSDRALDFSNIDNLTAYTATLSGDKVSFNEVENSVPAANGLLVKGVTGQEVSAKVPFVQGGELSAIQNILIGVNEQTVVDKSGIFVLTDGEHGLGFYKTTTPSTTIAAHTAYMDNISEASFISLNGEPTSIDVRSKMETVRGEVYNLNGQRVAQPTKGLYIINGKKAVVK